MSKAGGGDMSNLPEFFQMGRTGMTVLEGLDGLEEELGGALDDEEEVQGQAAAAGYGLEEEMYNPADDAANDADFDFVSSTSAGLPHQFQDAAPGDDDDDADAQVLDYYEILRQSVADKEPERGPPVESKVAAPLQNQSANAPQLAVQAAAPKVQAAPQSYAQAAGATSGAKEAMEGTNASAGHQQQQLPQGGALGPGQGQIDEEHPPKHHGPGPYGGPPPPHGMVPMMPPHPHGAHMPPFPPPHGMMPIPPPHFMGGNGGMPMPMPMPPPPHFMGMGPPPPPPQPHMQQQQQQQQQRDREQQEPHQPPVRIQQPRTFPNIKSISDVKPAKYMGRNDIRFVLSRILAPLDSEDPYTDDYYFIQMQVRKNNKLRAEAEKKQAEARQEQERRTAEGAAGSSKAPASVPLPPELIIPLPTWKETKAKLRARLAQSQRDILRKNVEWATKEGSLGVQIRSSVRNPKKQLAISSVRDIWSADVAGGETDEGAGGGAGSGQMEPFGTKLWKVRACILQCHESLCSVRELDQLLRYYQRHGALKARAFHLHQNSASVVAARQSAFNSGDAAAVAAAQRTAASQREAFESEQRALEEVVRDIVQERNAAVDALALSIGVTAATPSEEKGGLDGGFDTSPGMSLDRGLFAALLSTIKGKRVLLAALPLLTPAQRWAVAPTLLVKVLQNSFSIPVPAGSKADSASSSSSSSGALERELEVKVLESLLQFVSGARTFQLEQEGRHMNLVAQHRHHVFLHGQQQNAAPLPPPPPPHAFMTALLFRRIIDCVAAVVGTFDGAASKLRPSLLSSRHRSELLHAMITIAEEIAERLEAEAQAQANFAANAGGGSTNKDESSLSNAMREWTDVRSRFVSMLDEE